MIKSPDTTDCLIGSAFTAQECGIIPICNVGLLEIVNKKVQQTPILVDALMKHKPVEWIVGEVQIRDMTCRGSKQFYNRPNRLICNSAIVEIKFR